jgi:hypothetical protein
MGVWAKIVVARNSATRRKAFRFIVMLISYLMNSVPKIGAKVQKNN